MFIRLLMRYLLSLSLIISIVLGGVIGSYFEDVIPYLKPIGDIFLNLIFTGIVPLVFFSVASAIAKIKTLGRLGKIFSSMAVVFLSTGIVAALYALVVVLISPPANGISYSHNA